MTDIEDPVRPSPAGSRTGADPARWSPRRLIDRITVGERVVAGMVALVLLVLAVAVHFLGGRA